MTGELKFNLPEEQEEFDMAISAPKLACVISEMFNELRKVWKYSDNKKEVANAEKWRDKLVEIIQRFGLSSEDF